MSTYSIENAVNCDDRYKLFLLLSSIEGITDSISWLNSKEIKSLNLGKAVANYIDSIDDYRYLTIEVLEHIEKLLDTHKSKFIYTGNDVVAIYNFGILLEPALELNAVQLLKDFSKTSALIIIWENQMPIPNYLNWPTQQNNFFLDFTETPLKTLQYAI